MHDELCAVQQLTVSDGSGRGIRERDPGEGSGFSLIPVKTSQNKYGRSKNLTIFLKVLKSENLCNSADMVLEYNCSRRLVISVVIKLRKTLNWSPNVCKHDKFVHFNVDFFFNVPNQFGCTDSIG